MDTTTQVIIGIAVVVFAKLLLGGKADKGADLPALVKNGALIVDTRTAEEFAQGHIQEAILIPHYEITKKIGAHVSDKSSILILYCRSGTRSSVAKKALVAAGYTNVFNGGSLHRMYGKLGK